MQQKAILILGGSNDQLFMIDTAQRMGLITVVVDGNDKAPGLLVADHAQAIDFSDTQTVITYCQLLIKQGVHLAGVLTMGSDVPHLLAKIAQHFCWVAPSMQTAKVTTDKFLMKVLFSEHNIAVPKYALVTNNDEIKQQWAAWECSRVIIKPIDAAGSRGVSICRSKADISHLYQHALRNSKSGHVMVEEYIEGDQISTESIIYRKQCYHPGFADRVYDDTPHFHPYIMENGGWQPSSIHTGKHQEICQLIDRVALALNLENGVLKGDIVYSTKYKQPMVIEVASRLSGGDFSASLVPLAHQINYIKTAIQIAIDDPVDLSELTPKTSYIVANRYFFLPPGKLMAIHGIEEAKKMKNLKKLEFNYQIGDDIPVIRNHGQRVGVFIVQGDTRQQVRNLIEQLYQTITFTVDEVPCNGHPRYYRIR
ncbi:MAG TPA: ATP-grasp domain-containing protein [Gammaproteobacteria bacterium]|nr:ATP-grasp domain-containing protein [Gammaproteobacteria bacterium]